MTNKPTCIDCGKELKMKAACVCEECVRKTLPVNLQELLNPRVDKP